MRRPETSFSPTSEDCRCVCGRLVARFVPGGVQLKCRRCKRTMLVALPGGAAPKHVELEITPEREAG
jgi:hypothetical protein